MSKLVKALTPATYRTDTELERLATDVVRQLVRQAASLSPGVELSSVNLRVVRGHQGKQIVQGRARVSGNIYAGAETPDKSGNNIDLTEVATLPEDGDTSPKVW